MPSLHIKILKSIALTIASILITFLAAYGVNISANHINEWWGFLFGCWSVTLGMSGVFGLVFGLIKIYE